MCTKRVPLPSCRPVARVHAPRLEVAADRAATRSRDRRPGPAARPRCRRSSATPKPMSPVHSVIDAVMAGRGASAPPRRRPVMRSCSSSRLLGRGDRDQLDLGELVLADHAARVACRRRPPRSGSTACSAVKRSGSCFSSSDLLAHQVGERHFGGRDQPEAVSVASREQVLGELRQLAGAERAASSRTSSGGLTSV